MLSIINTILQLYLIILILRLLLEWSRASGYNPICRWLVKLTQPVLRPFQFMLNSKGYFNWPCLVVIVIINALQLCSLMWANMQTLPSISHLAIAIVGNTLYFIATIFFWGIIIHAIISWIAMINHSTSPLHEVLYYLTKPLLAPAQRIIPPIGGIDISPVPVLILLQLFTRFIITPLIAFGLS